MAWRQNSVSRLNPQRLIESIQGKKKEKENEMKSREIMMEHSAANETRERKNRDTPILFHWKYTRRGVSTTGERDEIFYARYNGQLKEARNEKNIGTLNN